VVQFTCLTVYTADIGGLSHLFCNKKVNCQPKHYTFVYSFKVYLLVKYFLKILIFLLDEMIEIEL